MSSAPDATPWILPAGLSDKGGDFNRVSVDSFERIVLTGHDIRAMLADEKQALMAVMET